MKQKLVLIASVICLLVFLMPVAVNAINQSQIDNSARPDVLVVEIGHTLATDLATKVISDNLANNMNIDPTNSSSLPKIVNNFGTVTFSTTLFTNQYKLRTIQSTETSLPNLENTLHSYKSVLLIVVAHGLDNGTGLTDGVNSVQWNNLAPILSTHAEYTFFASCNSTSVSQVNSHMFGLPGIIDATIAGYLASAWAFQAFGENSIASDLLNTMVSKYFGNLFVPVNPLGTININISLHSIFTLISGIVILFLIGEYLSLGIDGWVNALGVYMLNWAMNQIWNFLWNNLFSALSWIGALLSPLYNVVQSVVDVGFIAFIDTELDSTVAGEFELAGSGNMYAVTSAFNLLFMGTALTGNSLEGTVYWLLSAAFNLIGSFFWGSSGSGFGYTLVSSAGFITNMLSICTTVGPALKFMQNLHTTGTSILTDFIGGLATGYEAVSAAESLWSVLTTLYPSIQNIHFPINYNLTYFFGIPNGLYIGLGNIWIDSY